uniref:Uncharacterized protein n=1 Tax=Arundo donax TaxID=35708 RepID=A0A0A9AU41_ARUDO
MTSLMVRRGEAGGLGNGPFHGRSPLLDDQPLCATALIMSSACTLAHATDELTSCLGGSFAWTS